jgi:hypothetical protein
MRTGLKILCKGKGAEGKLLEKELVMSRHEQVVIQASSLGHIQEALHCQVCQGP